MDLGWAATIQAVLIAISTAYVRSQAKKDRDKIVHGTAAQSTSEEIRDDVKQIKVDIAILKMRELERSKNLIDHRSPKGE